MLSTKFLNFLKILSTYLHVNRSYLQVDVGSQKQFNTYPHKNERKAPLVFIIYLSYFSSNVQGYLF
jgi:hypothetical protein